MMPGMRLSRERPFRPRIVSGRNWRLLRGRIPPASPELEIEREVAADHRAIVLGADRFDAQILVDIARPQQIGDPAHLGALFAGGGRVILDLFPEALADHLVEQFVMLERGDQFGAIGQLAGLAAGMGDDDLVVILVGLRLAQERGEGGEAGACGKEPEPLAGHQRIMHQRADRRGPQDDLVAGLDMLQPGGERAVGHLDRVEFELFVPGGRSDRIGAQQRLLLAGIGIGIAHQPDHHEFAGAEPQGGRAGAAEGKQPVGIMFHFCDRLGIGQGGFSCCGCGLGLGHWALLVHIVRRQTICPSISCCGTF